MQLIFRKVSDLQKEKELAERRKNDPVLNTSQDHLVRKLFSKFKKTSGNDLASPHSIGSGSIVAAEHGAGINAIQVTQGNNNNNVTSPNASNSITPVITDAAKQRKMSTAMGIAKARPGGGGGGWAKLLVSEKYFQYDDFFKIPKNPKITKYTKIRKSVKIADLQNSQKNSRKFAKIRKFSKTTKNR